MCPFCITTAALSVAGAASFVGVIAAVARKWRLPQRWICGCRGG